MFTLSYLLAGYLLTQTNGKSTEVTAVIRRDRCNQLIEFDKFVSILIMNNNFLYILDYGFHWTIPHCVLTLRLIAISFNLLDGQRCKSITGTPCDHEDHLADVPGFMEFFAHCLHPCSFLVGPQFEIHIFQKFLRRTEQTYNIV